MKGASQDGIGIAERPALVCARDRLDGSLVAFREDIQAAAQQFTELAADLEQVLEATAGIVTCVEEECVPAIGPVAECLGTAARKFLADRMGSVSSVGESFARETAMLERLGGLTAKQHAIAREARTLSVLAAVEVARLGSAGQGFECMAQELAEFSTTIQTGSEGVRQQIEQRRQAMAQRQKQLQTTLGRMRQRFDSIEAELGEAISGVDRAVTELIRIPSDFRSCLSEIGERVSRVVAAVQTEDMTRQQTEHVREALQGLIEEQSDGAGPTPEENARRAALLDIQQLQMETARAGTADWIAQIDECIHGISSIGQSEVAAMGARILEQGEGLQKQLERIEELKRESASDDADLMECIAGLRGLMEIAQVHLGRLQNARDRMRLLNFNSMVEARRLGTQAVAVLEIARSISRISAEWSELTDRSSEAIEAMLSASAQSEEEHRAATRASLDALEAVQRDGKEGMAALNGAAAIAGNGAARAESAVARLQQRIDGLGRIAGRLRDEATTVDAARREVMDAGEKAGRAGAGAEFDRQRLEAECAAHYTCELERRVLRAALYGEPLGDIHAAVAGNDVELF